MGTKLIAVAYFTNRKICMNQLFFSVQWINFGMHIITWEQTWSHREANLFDSSYERAF